MEKENEGQRLPKQSNQFRPASFPKKPRLEETPGDSPNSAASRISLNAPPPTIPSELGDTNHRYPLFERGGSIGVDSIIRSPQDPDSVLESISELPVPDSEAVTTPPDAMNVDRMIPM